LIGMPRLQIPLHSRRVTSLAVAGLAVVAAAAFSFGIEHQFRRDGASPMPAGQMAVARGGYADGIPEATPARDLAVAVDTRVRHHMPPAEVLEVPDQVAAPGPLAAQAPPAVDAAAVAPDPAPPPSPPKAPDNSEEPPT